MLANIAVPSSTGSAAVDLVQRHHQHLKVRVNLNYLFRRQSRYKVQEIVERRTWDSRENRRILKVR
jgi:hypothetical protein